MLFYTKHRKDRNVKLVDAKGKDICQFTPVSKDRGELETTDTKLIALLKNKDKYPFIFWTEKETNKQEK